MLEFLRGAATVDPTGGTREGVTWPIPWGKEVARDRKEALRASKV